MLRDERARVRADEDVSDSQRGEQLKRLDDIATSLAKNAVRDPALLALLGEDAVVSDEARSLEREMLRRAGIETAPVEAPPVEETPAAPVEARCGAAVGRLAADGQPVPRPRLLGRASEHPARDVADRLGAPRPAAALVRARRATGPRSAWTCPSPAPGRRPAACELMPHQAQLVAAAAEGHRTFLLADEPGLGKTAEALLAAEAAKAYPLLVVVPNVVKTNWVREAGLWSTAPPGHRDPGQRRLRRRLRRHRRRQLRGARPARRVARRLRLPRHGRRRGALHQEQDLAALAARAGALRAHPGLHRAPAADGPHRHAR